MPQILIWCSFICGLSGPYQVSISIQTILNYALSLFLDLVDHSPPPQFGMLALFRYTSPRFLSFLSQFHVVVSHDVSLQPVSRVTLPYFFSVDDEQEQMLISDYGSAIICSAFVFHVYIAVRIQISCVVFFHDLESFVLSKSLCYDSWICLILHYKYRPISVTAIKKVEMFEQDSLLT